MRRSTFRLSNMSPRAVRAAGADHARTDIVGQRLLSEGTPKEVSWPVPAGLYTSTKRPFAIPDRPYGLYLPLFPYGLN
jgi:hypothetical protein